MRWRSTTRTSTKLTLFAPNQGSEHPRSARRPHAKPSGHRALHHPQLRLRAACTAGAVRRNALRPTRPRGPALAAHARAHLLDARHVARVDTIEPRQQSGANDLQWRELRRCGRSHCAPQHGFSRLRLSSIGAGQGGTQVVDERNAIQRFVNVRVVGDAAYAAIPVRFALELGNWKEAASLPPWKSEIPYAEAITYFGRAVARAVGTREEQTLISPASASSKRSLWRK